MAGASRDVKHPWSLWPVSGSWSMTGFSFSSWLQQHYVLFTQSCVLLSSQSSPWCCFIRFWPTEGPRQETSQVNKCIWVLMRHSESQLCKKKKLLIVENKTWDKLNLLGFLALQFPSYIGWSKQDVWATPRQVFRALYLFTFCLISCMRSSPCLLGNHGNRWTA